LHDSLLELYILSLFDRGFETAYDLQTQGRISLGSSVPSLRRMEASGLIRRKASQESSKRKRHAFAVTAKGKHTVQTCWAGLLVSAPPSDLDAVLRTVDILRTYQVPPQEIAKFLTRAAAERTAMAKRINNTAPDPTPGLEYLTSRHTWDLNRFRMEAKFLAQLAKAAM